MIALVVGSAFGAAAIAQTPDTKKPDAKKPDAKATAAGDKAAGHDADMAKMMESWKKASTPAEGHAKLAPIAGKWTYVTKARMTPDEPFHESTGKAEYKWTLGRRFLMQEIKGNPSPDDAMMGGPFEGFGMLGYDNMTKKYISVWTDNMSTGMMTSEGTADGSGKTFTFTTEEGYICPMSGQLEKPRTVLKMIGEDKLVFEMHNKGPDGKEFMNLEVTYARAK